MAQIIEIGPQSHFDFPNSNVRPIGPVKVKQPGRSSLFYPPMPTGDDDMALYNAALQQVEGGDLVTDYIKTTRLYSAWLVPIYWSEHEIEGTVAEMEVGRQRLR